MIGTLMLVLLAMPLALSMLNYQTTNLENLSARPIRTFGLSGDPTVEGDPIITNPDTTDNLYCGGYKDYIMTCDIEDADGYAEIFSVNLILIKGAVEYGSFLWTNTTNAWAENAGTDNIRLTTGTNTTHATEFNITITFKLEWACTDVDDVDLRVQIITAPGATEVNDTIDTNYDLDSDLTLTSDVFFTYAEEGQGDLMTLNTLTYSYEDSVAAIFPLAAETDFWVSRAARAGWPIAYYEADSYVDGTGVATWAQIRASDNEHTDTFTLYAVTQDGTGTGTTLMDASHTDTIDIVEGNPIQTTRLIDGVPDIGITPEGAVVIGIGVVVIGGVGYFYYGRSGTRGTRRRSTKKRKPKKPTKRKRR